ncbi:MAG: tetratricopeptide repeat protein, partial [Myxococcota bacterium]
MSDKPGTSQPPVNITELEMAFARDPTSDACLPLLDAYLAQGRHMEAMVLGRKAVKAKPEDKARRILLARVYADQGKLPKAVEEVQAILKMDPNHAASHVMLGRLHERGGKPDDAVAAFKAAIDAEPDNAEAKAALAARGITYSKAPPPPPPPPPSAPAPQVSQA